MRIDVNYRATIGALTDTLKAELDIEAATLLADLPRIVQIHGGFSKDVEIQIYNVKFYDFVSK